MCLYICIYAKVTVCVASSESGVVSWQRPCKAREEKTNNCSILKFFQERERERDKDCSTGKEKMGGGRKVGAHTLSHTCSFAHTHTHSGTFEAKTTYMPDTLNIAKRGKGRQW